MIGRGRRWKKGRVGYELYGLEVLGIVVDLMLSCNGLAPTLNVRRMLVPRSGLDVNLVVSARDDGALIERTMRCGKVWEEVSYFSTVFI